MNVEEVKELAKIIFSLLSTDPCTKGKKGEAELQDCGNSGYLIIEFYGDCKPLLDISEVKKIMESRGVKLSILGYEIGNGYIKIHIAEKEGCKLNRINVEEEELEIPKVENISQLDALKKKFDKFVVVYTKSPCEVCDEILPEIISLAVKLAIDPLPIFEVQYTNENKIVNEILDRERVSIFPTAILYVNGKEAKRIEGISIGSNKDKDKAIKEMIKEYRNLIEGG